MRHWTAEQIREACDDKQRQQDMFKDVLEQRDIAVVTLRRLADEVNMSCAAVSAGQFGSAGAGIAYRDVQKYATETLAKMNVPSTPLVVDTRPVPTAVTSDGLCDAVSEGVRCKDPWNHPGDWHYGGAGVCWRR